MKTYGRPWGASCSSVRSCKHSRMREYAEHSTHVVFRRSQLRLLVSSVARVAFATRRPL